MATILEGTSIELGRGGSVDRATLRRHSVSQSDVDEALHQASVDGVEKTRRIVLEPSGKINVLKS